MKKVLVFDFDGTIADSLENFIEIVTKLSLKHNLPVLTREELEKLRSEDAKSLIKQLKIPFYKIPFLARDMKAMQQEEITKIKPVNGLPIVLHELKAKGFTLGIITSNAKTNVKLFLTSHDLDIFEFIYSDSSIFGKDKVIQKFLKQHMLRKEEILYVGDEIRDIQACKKVPVEIVAVTWGFNSKEGLAKYNPDFLIEKPTELLKL